MPSHASSPARDVPRHRAGRRRRGRHIAPRTRRASPIASRKATAVGLTVALALLVSTAIFGVTALRGPASDRAVTAADAAARRRAADRADRASRLAPGTAMLVGPGAATGATRDPSPGVTAAPKPAWVSPMPGAAITSCFGPRWGAMHQGIDFALAEGTPIRAAAAGTVLGAGWLYSGYGMSVMIDNGQGVFTHYAHAEQVLVSAGERVAPGQVIALEGATGDATGPHLHFEVHLGLWHQVDPAPYLRARGVAVAGC